MTTKTGTIRNIIIFLEMIKFSHTIFALPFALTGALLAANGIPDIQQLFWIILAMAGARIAARAISAGLIGKGTTLVFSIASIILLLVAAAKSIFLIGILASTAMLLYERWLLRNGNLEKLDAAFFTMNGYISVVIMVATTGDIIQRRMA